MPKSPKQVCLSEGCGKSASLQCPKCAKLGRDSFFCSQECFKKSWPAHKETHSQPEPGHSNRSRIDVTSTAEHIAHATETLREIRRFTKEAAANAELPHLPDEQKDLYESKLAAPAGTSTWAQDPDLLTPNTMLRFETPRLVVRSVKPEDLERLYSVKGDARVNKFQLYGQPSPSSAMSFGKGYIRDRIPHCGYGGTLERTRYVFAITPKASVIPAPSDAVRAIPRVKGLPAQRPLPHADDTYIGNIAIEFASFPLDGFGGGSPEAMRLSLDGAVLWPDVDSDPARGELDEWAARLFYEIAPQYWGQGLMHEAMLAISDFIFCDLGLGHLVIDPLAENTASIALARKYPDMAYRGSVPCMADLGRMQHVFSVSRAEYLARFGRPALAPLAGAPCCAYCCNPRARVRGGGETCARCGVRWYCGLECRAADWAAAGGHGARCKV